MSMWNMMHYVFNAEIVLTVLLMAVTHLPKFVRRPIKQVMKGLNSPLLGHFTIFFVVILAAAFAETMLSLYRHKGHHHDHNRDNCHAERHDAKRLRTERNSYLAFGSLFLVLVISQLWSLLKRIIDLEEAVDKESIKMSALMKQVKNREDQAGLLEVAKELSEMEKTGQVGEKSAADYQKIIAGMQIEIEQLKAARNVETELKSMDAAAASELKKRPGGKVAKDE